MIYTILVLVHHNVLVLCILTCTCVLNSTCVMYLYNHLNNLTNFIQELYRKIEQEVKRHMECCSKEFAQKQFPNNTAFLRELADIWGKHSKQTVRL